MVEIKTKNEAKEQEKTWSQITAILIMTLAGLTNGIFYGWSSPFLIKIVEDKVNYDITEEEASYFNVIPPLAMTLVSPFVFKFPDLIGRKKTILLIVVPQLLYWICSATAKSVYVFYAARAFGGIADAVFFAAVPIYVGEISDPNIRGTWGNLIVSAYYVGQFIINILGSHFSVKETSYICLVVPILFFVLFLMMPESPYYYLIRGQDDNAKKSLTFLKRTNNIEDVFVQLKADVKRQMSESGTWSELFTIKSNRKALMAGGFLRFSQQMSGLIVFVTYTQFIFQKAGGNIGHELSSIVYLGLQMILNFLVLLLIVHKFGRRTCIISSLCSCALTLYVMGTYYYIDGNTLIDLSNYQWFPIASMVVFQIMASFGVAVIPTLMLSELFSASIKTKGMMIMIAMFGVGNSFANFAFYKVNVIFGFYLPFYMFAVCNTLAALLFYFIIPETKGKTLEEIQQALKGNKIDRSIS